MVGEHNYTRKRTFWSDEEDARLVELVDVYGIHNWPEVAGALHGRDSKSCSLRWRYFLAPHIIRSTDQKLSDWEVAVLVWAQREYGNKWRTIVDNCLPWRSPNDLKNYCNQYVNGKHNHVITQNKLLLQNVPLAALLAHPPPEVQQRWMHVNAMRDSPKGQQRPVKKGTRGLSYIIRQAAKLKTQRSQPYPKPSAAAAAAPAAAAVGPSATAAADGGFQRRMSGPVGGPEASASTAGMYSTGAGTAAAAAGAGAVAGLGSYSSAAGVQSMVQGLTGSGNSSNSSSFSMQYSRPQSAVQYPSSSMGPPSMCSILPSMAMNMNSSFSSMNMNMPSGTVQSYPAAAAATAGVPIPGQGHMPWAPAMDNSPQGMNMNDGSASALAYTPSSASSCFTPTSMNAMNMASGAAAMNAGVTSPPGSQFAPGPSSAAAAAAGPVPGGAFGFQGGSFTSGPLTRFAGPQQQQQQLVQLQQQQQQQQQTAVNAGTHALWQEAPEFACSNSISSNSSSSYAVDAAGFPSPTNHMGAPHYHQQQQQHAQQQQQPVAAGPCTWQHMMGLPQQLLAPSQQQQQQHIQQAGYAQAGMMLPPASMAMPWPLQPQQQQQLEADFEARSSGTGAGALPVGAVGPPAAVVEVGSPVDSFGSIDIMGFDASDVYDEDLKGIADLLGSDCGDGFDVEHGTHVAAMPAAAVGGCFVTHQQQIAMVVEAAEGTQPEAAAAAAVAPLKVELRDVQPAQPFSLDDTSAGGANVDLGAVLSIDAGFDFNMTSDDFEMLAQAAGW